MTVADVESGSTSTTSGCSVWRWGNYGQKNAVWRQLFEPYMYMLLWIALSATTILLNKFILDPKMGGFPYPLTLTCIHMGFCSITAWSLIKAGVVAEQKVTFDTYTRSILPIAGLFAVVLWMGNAAYMYLSVSFIQMLKASMPMLVYVVGCVLGTEKPKCNTALTLMVVVTGVCIASYGELRFVLVGVVLQMLSIGCEAFRLALVQILLQGTSIKLNPITTMSHISPACFALLFVASAVWELPSLLANGLSIQPMWLVASAVIAFGLNISVFLLIGKTSALTMNVAGVVKDWMLIELSVLLFGSPFTGLQLAGYGLATVGVFWYNYAKIQAARQQAQEKEQQPKEKPGQEAKLLLSVQNYEKGHNFKGDQLISVMSLASKEQGTDATMFVASDSSSGSSDDDLPPPLSARSFIAARN